MGIYYMRCAVCKEEGNRFDNNYYDFFRHMTGDFGWQLMQDKDGNLKPVCDKCSERIYSLYEDEGNFND